jgi:hypothetical protein
VNPRGPRPGCIAPIDTTPVEAVVRAMRGNIGAAALAQCCEGLSRRGAAIIKSRTLTAMENERQAGLGRVTVAPGVIRGFDAMYITDGYLLCAADAAIPYRTSVVPVDDYAGPLVAWVLDEDFTKHGAPLVVRLDRAKQHATPEVLSVLERHGVLAMHGPPRHPGFYGQLERLNREHSDFLGDRTTARADVPKLLRAYNEVLPRRRLGWRTAGEAWRARLPLQVDRKSFKDEVQDISRRMQETREARAWCAGTADRFAIEAALKRRGLLCVERGGWC